VGGDIPERVRLDREEDKEGGSARLRGWSGKERRQYQTHIIQINIDPTVVSNDEVANRIDPLNWMSVAVVGVQEPGIVRLDE